MRYSQECRIKSIVLQNFKANAVAALVYFCTFDLFPLLYINQALPESCTEQFDTFSYPTNGVIFCHVLAEPLVGSWYPRAYVHVPW